MRKVRVKCVKCDVWVCVRVCARVVVSVFVSVLSVLSVSVSLQVQFTLAHCTLVFSTCHRHTNALALAQGVPHNRVSLDVRCRE